ncbi:hypothetical protein I302_107051 [Kwoniella bestiolae CBS 10118]|uniref:Protein CPL1-like domain-containing protein n=1 Tax=Kwoniella bestiolae CBS 10118 TaxID=1296100 RepID=A0A1B9FZN3_9TREE|nr:hypothetical protein I302_05684 [Kwoniella bestiolae CBS 10118]OCF24225.1 hypothetical protein I302_05684 [Kwoniella bestiolae CBS 10118]
MSRIIVGFSLLMGLMKLVAADGLFVACVSYSPYFDSTLSGTYTSQTDCAAACSGSDYSYLTTAGSCKCSNAGPSVNSVQDGNGNSCSQISVDIVSTTFDSTTCYASSGFVATDFTGLSPVVGPKECLNTCAYDRIAVAQAVDRDQWYCGCASSVQSTPVSCTAGSYRAFNHPAGAAASGLARRRAREAAAWAKRVALLNICPGGMTACLIPGLGKNDAWECIDTQNDLESCGGCLYGAYNNVTSTAGVSCAQTGVKLGAATCAAGKCLVSECKDGYTLVDNHCLFQS